MNGDERQDCRHETVTTTAKSKQRIGSFKFPSDLVVFGKIIMSFVAVLCLLPLKKDGFQKLQPPPQGPLATSLDRHFGRREDPGDEVARTPVLRFSNDIATVREKYN